MHQAGPLPDSWSGARSEFPATGEVANACQLRRMRGTADLRSSLWDSQDGDKTAAILPAGRAGARRPASQAGESAGDQAERVPGRVPLDAPPSPPLIRP